MHRLVTVSFFIAALLATYLAFGHEQSLAERIMNADEKRFIYFFPKLKEQAEQEVPVLIGEIERKLPPDAIDDSKENLAKRQANAAVALLKLNHPEKVWPLLKHSPDPRARSYLIHRMGPLGVDPRTLFNHIESEPDITIRRALLLSLGEFDESVMWMEDRKAFLPKLEEMYRTEADAGFHAASEWLLRQWDNEVWLKEINKEWARDKTLREKRLERIRKASPQWYVNGEGQTMVVIPGPVEFLMGSPEKEAKRVHDEQQHKRRIGRTFALSAKLVTVEQYRQFDREYKLPDNIPPTPDLPVAETSWYDAAEYCNWLSEKEGLPEEQWCFEITGTDIKWKRNYLTLTGYRLATEAEMEYATRAGTSTARYFGETHELLSMYAWYDENSQKRPWPVGLLKPNDFGFFDTLGNLAAWCMESSMEYPIGNSEAVEDREDDLSGKWKDRRAIRGNSFWELSSVHRSASRNDDEPITSVGALGFRLARTVPSQSDNTTKDGETK